MTLTLEQSFEKGLEMEYLDSTPKVEIHKVKTFILEYIWMVDTKKLDAQHKKNITKLANLSEDHYDKDTPEGSCREIY